MMASMTHSGFTDLPMVTIIACNWRTHLHIAHAYAAAPSEPLEHGECAWSWPNTEELGTTSQDEDALNLLSTGKIDKTWHPAVMRDIGRASIIGWNEQTDVE